MIRSLEIILFYQATSELIKRLHYQNLSLYFGGQDDLDKKMRNCLDKIKVNLFHGEMYGKDNLCTL